MPRSASDSTKSSRKEPASPGDQQRQGDGAEDVKLAGAQAERRLFHGGIDALQHGANDQIGDREEGDDLDKDQAVQPVDVVDAQVPANAENLPGDQAVAPKEQDGGDGDGKGRRDGRQQGDDVDAAREGHGAAHQGIGEDEAQNRAAGGRAQPHDHGVAQDLQVVVAVVGVDILLEILEAESPGFQVEEALPHDAQDGKGHKDEDKDTDDRADPWPESGLGR